MEKVVLVTGATRGIGRATALKFAAAGYIVVANYKSRGDLAETLQAELSNYNPRSFCYRADVTDEQAVKELFQTLYRAFPAVDVVVNNAGVSEQKLLIDMTAKEFTEMLNNNLLPVMLTSKEYIARQTARSERGSIVNVSSIYGVDGGAVESHYSAAKAGVIGFTKAIAKEYAYMQIRANVVAPGAVATDMTLSHTEETLRLLREEIPLGRLASAAEIAEGIFYLAEAEYVTGEVLKISGGL